MSKDSKPTDKCATAISGSFAKCAMFLLFLVFQASCSGEQQSPTVNQQVVEESGYLQFRPIVPGPTSDFDELYALTGNYSSPSLSIRAESVPHSLVGSERSSGIQVLRIFHINDQHHHLSDQVGELTEYRAARIAKLVQDGRRSSTEDEAVLFISAGDDAAGTRFDELIGFKPDEFVTHPGYETYSRIGMDVAVLGNHEFDWGTDMLELSITKSAAFPIISSNIWSANEGWPVYGSLLGTINGFRIAFLGFTLPSALPVQSLQAQGYEVLGISGQLTKMIPVLEPYVDFYILVNHIGFYRQDASSAAASNQLRGDIGVARLLSGLSDKPAIIIGGHTHTVLNKDGLEVDNVINNIPILQTGAFGRWLGDASVTLSRSEHRIKASYSAHLIGIDVSSDQPSAATLIDTELQKNTLQPMEVLLQDKFSTVIGNAVNDPGLSARETELDRYTDESALLNILADAVVNTSKHWAEGQLDFAAINATSVSGGLSGGTSVTYGDVFALMPYADTVFLLNITGQQLKEIIENNAGRVRQIEEFVPFGGKLDPGQFHGRGFLQFSAGIRYVIDTDPESGRRAARDIYLNGKPVDDVLDKRFKFAIPRYVATGRGSWAGESLLLGEPGEFVAIDMRKLVASYGHDTGRVWRSELLAYFKTHSQEISEPSRKFKDGRVRVVN